LIRALAFACPADIRADYPDIDSCNFDGDGYFLLRCKPGDWSADDSYLLEGGYDVTFRRLRRKSSIELAQRGYRIKTSGGQAAMFYLVERLAKAFRPIAIKDYLRPEDADFRAARTAVTSPFTARSGLISKVEPAGGLVGTTGAELWFQGGFSFEFKEERVR
jgi:hypothetical protein